MHVWWIQMLLLFCKKTGFVIVIKHFKRLNEEFGAGVLFVFRNFISLALFPDHHIFDTVKHGFTTHIVLSLQSLYSFCFFLPGLAQDLTPEDKLPIGKNVLELSDIRESANYTCVAASVLGVIEQTSIVKVQCK